MDLRELINRSGDSQLLSYSYEDGALSFSLDMSEFEARVDFSVETDVVRAGKLPPGVGRVCRIELIELAGALRAEKGIFVPAADFPGMMREVRSGAFLAYGRRAREAKWLLNLRGSRVLLSCLAAELNKITWESGSE